MSEKITWSTTKKKVSELIPWEINPRTMDVKQAKVLKDSLKTFGLVEIPVINADNTIIAGHQRIQVLKSQNPDLEIEVRVPDRALTPEEFMRYNLTSNRNTGQWDYDLLGNNFDIEMLESAGFSDTELQSLGEPIEMDENTIKDKLDRFNNAAIKQIVLYFSADEFESVYERLLRVSEQMGVEDNSTLFIKLLDHYEGNNAGQEGS